MAGSILYLDLSFPDGGKSLRAAVVDNPHMAGNPLEAVEVSFETSIEPAAGTRDLHWIFDALAEHNEILSCSQAVVMIGDRDLAFRYTHLPFSSPKKIHQVLPLELAPSLPWPDQPCLTDFFVQEISFVRNRHQIFSASVQESLVRDIVTGLKHLGITPQLIAPKGYTAALCFLDQTKEARDAVFIHFAPGGSTLVLAADGQPVMVRSLPFPMAGDDLAREIHRTCNGWGQLSDSTPDFSLILSCDEGTGAEISNLLDDFQQKVTQGSLKDMPEFNQIRTHRVLSGCLPRPTSQSRINFCKGDYGPGGAIKKYLGELITAAVISGLAVLLFFAGLYLDVARLEHQVNRLRSHEADIYRETFPEKPLNPVHSPLLLMQSHIKAAENRQATMGTDLEAPPSAKALDLLYALSKSIPKAIDTDLTRLLFSQNHLTLTGSTHNFNAVDRLKTALEKSPLFSTVTIITAEAGKAGGRVMFKFRVEME